VILKLFPETEYYTHDEDDLWSYIIYGVEHMKTHIIKEMFHGVAVACSA
jgi:hypothetical protein